MYLRHVVADIAQGRYGRRPLETLPRGLEAYYEDHWRRMGMSRRPLPRPRIQILFVLCELRRPASRALLADLATTAELPIAPLGAQEVLDEWAQFLHEERDGGVSVYSVYHSSFREFLHRKDIVQAAGVSLTAINGQIADKLYAEVFPGG